MNILKMFWEDINTYVEDCCVAYKKEIGCRLNAKVHGV